MSVRPSVISFLRLLVVLVISLINVSCLGLCYLEKTIESLEPPSTGKYVYERKDNRSLIIFVHGLFGDKVSTWKNLSSGVYWPNLFEKEKDNSFSDFNIYVEDYGSPYFCRTATIYEVANHLRQRLIDEEFFVRYDQIFFIAHSMGGLITKQILVDLNTRTDSPKLRRVRAVLFLSTPAQGAPLGALSSWLSMSSQARELLASDLNSYLQTLEDRWKVLRVERDQYHQVFPKCYSAYETDGPLGEKIVSRIYAHTSCDDSPLGMNRLDHKSMAKPYDENNEPHRWAKGKILKLAGEKVNLEPNFSPSEERDFNRAKDLTDHDPPQYTRAISLMEKLKKAYPASHRVRYRLGTILYNAEKYKEAEIELLVAKELDESDASTRYNLARTYYRLGGKDDLVKSVEEAEMALQIDSNHNNARFLLAIIAYEKKEFSRAIEFYKAIEKFEGPDLPDALISHASAILADDKNRYDSNPSELLLLAIYKAKAIQQTTLEWTLNKICRDITNNSDPLSKLVADPKINHTFIEYAMFLNGKECLKNAQRLFPQQGGGQ